MRAASLCLGMLLLAAPSFSQTAASAVRATPSATPRAKTSRAGSATATARFKPDIPVNTPIFTLDGVCPPPQKGSKLGAECKTVITRGQLDALVAALDPEASPKAHQQFALSYARLLAATKLAEQRHIDKDPAVAREIQLQQTIARMQVLSNYVFQSLQKQATHVPQKDVEAYYKKNSEDFQQAEVRRIAVPLGAPTESGQPLDPAVVKAKLEELRDRIAKGDDIDALQQRAYKELGVKGNVPLTTLTVVRRQVQSPQEAKVFTMDLGEVSPVFDNQGVVLILRLESKRELSLDEARPQIEASLQLQNTVDGLRNAFKGITADFNTKYMDLTSQPDLFPASVVTQNQFRRGSGSGLRAQP